MEIKHKTWVEISGSNIRKNIINIKKKIGNDVLLMFVVKSNAYGLGIREAVILSKKLVDWYGVNSLSEANEVRKFCNKPILILGYVMDSEVKEIVKKNYRVMVFNNNLINYLSKHASSTRKANVHIKIDTGLGRLGIEPDSVLEFIKYVKRFPNIIIEGAYTHYGRLMDEDENNIYEKQLNRFKKIINILSKNNIDVKIKHTASSMAAVLYDNTRFDLVRTGILMSGLWGSQSIVSLMERKKEKIEIFPVLSWKTRVINIKKVAAGKSIDYMNVWKVKKKTIIAIINVGYYDGLDRNYADKGHVLINGKYAKIIGKIFMNMCVVDVSQIKNVQVGNEVVIIGKSRNSLITAYDVADAMGTSTYEVVTKINPLIPRIII